MSKATERLVSALLANYCQISFIFLIITYILNSNYHGHFSFYLTLFKLKCSNVQITILIKLSIANFLMNPSERAEVPTIIHSKNLYTSCLLHSNQ